jgi:hypothetical protein
VRLSNRASVWKINVFAIPSLSIIGLEESEIGEAAIAFLLVIPAFFLDRLVARQREHEAILHAEQLRVVRATMRTVQDIVNNSLTELQLLRFDAGEGQVQAETLRLFDETIQRTAAQLTALGNTEFFAETAMVAGTGVRVVEKPA